MKTIQESINKIAAVCDYMLHPGKALQGIWNFTVDKSKVILIAVCLISFVIYITTDSKKAKKATMGSPVVYLLIQSINALLKGTL